MLVLILGGYGNFGKRIAQLLTRRGITVIIAGRDGIKAAALVESLPHGLARSVAFDISSGLSRELSLLRPNVVVNTCGPFQNADYSIAHACIAAGIHYIDLADGRDFVTGITQLDADARKQNVAVISGASTVPALTSAVIEYVRPRFTELDALTSGIAPGQKAERGLATTQAILSYVGKELRPCAGYRRRYGWQDLYRQSYPTIGKRWMANCEVPDLDLLPARYGLRRVRSSAGMENPVIHLGLWLLSWGVRLGVPLNLPQHAPALLKASHWFDFIGSGDGGMHVVLEGKNNAGRRSVAKWFILAFNGDGPYIPTVPAVVLVKQMMAGKMIGPGAMPCIGMITLQEYLDELEPFRIKTYEFDDCGG
jgi:hypothetical protein